MKKKNKFKKRKGGEKIGVAGLRSPCLPHAKGVLYQVSYNPNYIFISFHLNNYYPKMKEIKSNSILF